MGGINGSEEVGKKKVFFRRRMSMEDFRRLYMAMKNSSLVAKTRSPLVAR
jgi:hypothetical protein